MNFVSLVWTDRLGQHRFLPVLCHCSNCDRLDAQVQTNGDCIAVAVHSSSGEKAFEGQIPLASLDL